MQTIDEVPEIVASSNALPLETLQQQIMQPSPLQANLPVLKKAPYNYVVGEKCLAKWTDSRRWRATVQTVLELGKKTTRMLVFMYLVLLVERRLPFGSGTVSWVEPFEDI